MTFLFICLKVYSYCCDGYNTIYEMVKNKYLDVSMKLLNDSFTEVYFYDYIHQKKHHLRTNNSLWMLSYLYIKKFVFGYDITTNTCIKKFFSPFMFEPKLGIFEMVYFTNKHTYKYYTKGNHMNKNYILNNILEFKKGPKILYASLNNEFNITEFMNQHITSFQKENDITVYDIAMILLINKHRIPSIGNIYSLEIIEDLTLTERKFVDDERIVL